MTHNAAFAPMTDVTAPAHPDRPVLVPARFATGDLHAELTAGLTGAWANEGRDGLDAVCRHALTPTGKLFRPTLLLLSAAAVGGDPRSVLPAAIGTEWGHVASLVHDDVIDDDLLRRGRPSVFAAFGTDRAIVGGDALLFSLFGALAECRRTGVPDDRVVRTLALVAAAGVDLCRGQLLEAEVTGDLDCGIDAYVLVARLKTGALFRAACASGAELGGAPAESVDALATYGDLLGVAFQVRDDLLSFTSAPAVTGKAATSDVRNRRVTLPVLLAYAATPTSRRAVRRAFRAPCADTAFRMLRETVVASGALGAAEETAREYALRAQSALDVLPPSPARDALAEFALRAAVRDQ